MGLEGAAIGAAASLEFQTSVVEKLVMGGVVGLQLLRQVGAAECGAGLRPRCLGGGEAVNADAGGEAGGADVALALGIGWLHELAAGMPAGGAALATAPANVAPCCRGWSFVEQPELIRTGNGFGLHLFRLCALTRE